MPKRRKHPRRQALKATDGQRVVFRRIDEMGVIKERVTLARLDDVIDMTVAAETEDWPVPVGRRSTHGR